MKISMGRYNNKSMGTIIWNKLNNQMKSQH